MRITNKKRFRLFLVISVSLLILFVFCGVWAEIILHKPLAEQQDSAGKQTEEPSSEAAGSGQKNQQQPEENAQMDDQDKQESQDGEKTHEPEQPSGNTGSAGEGNSGGSSKPVVVPPELSPDQLYAAYNHTLIIGDSRVEGFKLYSGVKNASYFCMKAMTIDKIVDGKQVTVNGQSVSVYDMLDGGSYSKVIVGVGLNELGWNHIETFLAEYGQLIDEIRQRQPEATIYLQAVLPVSKTKNDNDKVHNNAQVYWYNENIIKLAQDKGVQFVNPAAALVDQDGFLVQEATTDGVHLNAAYCKVWAEYLAGLIK